MKRRRNRGRGPVAVLITLIMFATAEAGPGAPFASAQSPLAGAIEGIVSDAQGRPLNSVAVSVISRTTGRRQIVRTDRFGRYAAFSLAPGGYDVLAERLGFHPERVEGVVVAANQTRVLSLSLATVEGDEVRVTVRQAPAAISSVAGMVPGPLFLSGANIAGLPQGTGDLTGLTHLATSAGTRLDVQGLPAGSHTVTVDGLQLAKRPRAWGTYTRLASLPLAFFEAAEVGSGSPDVEYPGQAGALLSASSLRGGPVSQFRAWGDFGADALTFSQDDVEPFQSYRAGGIASGPLAGDTANFVVGVDYTRFRTPYASLWAPGSTTNAVVDAAAANGVDLDNLAGPGLAEFERVAAFGRLDAKIGEQSRISIRATMASLPTVVPFNAWTESPAAWQGNPKAREIFAAAVLESAIADGDVISESSVGYERSETSRESPADPLVDLPETIIASSGQTFGSQERRTVDMAVWSLSARQTFHVRNAGHHLKFGLSVLLPNYDMPWFYGRSGEYLFSTPDQLRSGPGRFEHIWGDDKVRSDFSTRRITVYAQDTWRPRPGFEVSGGARISKYTNLDTALVNDNVEWFRLTGLRNAVIKQTYTVVEPRFSLTIKPGGESDFTFRANAWVDADFADPGTIAEVISNWGLLGTRLVSGSRVWPTERLTVSPPSPVPTLTLLGPEFEGPRTSRLEASMSSAVGAGAAISFGVAVHRTDHLPRRKDLNLSPTVAATDQFGRAIHGQLKKSGSLLLAEPVSNRRFVEFDHVFGIEATGESRYVGFTVGAERPFANGFGAWASYTWSKTEGDWLTGNPRDPLSQLNPITTFQAADWRDGRSDFDVPHRALAGFEARLPGRVAPRLAALYRFQSGYPFTPGFRPGVDANADGSHVNDVAWVDESIPGARDVVAAWSCLQSQTGGFAERNACRGPNLHALDARLSFTFDLAGTTDVSLVVDAVNLIATEDGLVDRALYLVDPAASLVVSPDGRTYTVPLVANPDFGKLLSRFAPQRFLRLGLRVGV